MSAALFLMIAVVVGLLAMVLVIGTSGRRNKNTMSKEHAERVGLHGEEGLRRAEERHNEH